MKQILKYPGAKNSISEWICSFIPEHDVYLELFGGSLAVFFNKKPARLETINDLSEDIVNFYHVLRNYSEEFIQAMSLTPYSRQEYLNSWNNELPHEEPKRSIEAARRFSVHCWMAIGNGNLYKNGFRSGHTKNSPAPAKIWNNLPDELVEASQRLKKTQIENLPALELLERYKKPEVFIYADPPYLPETRKSNLYEHEMTKEDHIELLNKLKEHPGKVMISGYESDLYNEILGGWHVEKKRTQAEAGKIRTEVLWMNFEPRLRLF